MKCRFTVGQRVVCIGDFSHLAETEWAIILDVEYPKVGSIYTIREMRPGINDDEEESVGLLLTEIQNPVFPTTTLGGLNIEAHKATFQEPAFDSRAFSPLVDAKSDLSIFRKMLTPAGRIPVDA